MLRKPQNNRKKVYLSIFIVAIMVLSTFGIIANYTSPNQDTDYNGFSFYRDANGFWITSVNDQDYKFFFHPLDLGVEIPDEITEKIKQSKTITLTFSPKMQDLQYLDAARFELSQFLTERGIQVASGITEINETYGLPVVLCNPSSENPIIHFTSSNTTSASIDSSCITFTAATSERHLAHAEKIIYTLLGVI